jgi:glycosyltransferase involved in cell wall biosynthesis
MTSFSSQFPSLHCLVQKSPINPKISLAVRIKNEAKYIDAFWVSLKRQSYINNCEIVFLDSGSTDGTLEVLLQNECTVYSIAPEEFSFGRTCNLMMELTHADIVCFLSGHVLLVEENILEEVHNFFSNQGDLTAAYFRQVPNTVHGYSIYEKAFLNTRYSESKEFFVEAPKKHGFANSASVLTRNAWKGMPFADVIASEDFIWATSLLKMGGKLYYLPKLTVMHSHQESPEQIMKRVSINVQARHGQRSMPLQALFYWITILIYLLLLKASITEANEFAVAHSSAYLKRRTS